MLRRTYSLAALALVFLLGIAGPGFADGDEHKHDMHDAMKGHGDSGQPVELVGEIIDLTCYLSHPATGRGAEHVQCAGNCINQGLPSGLMVGDQLYVLLADHHKAANEMVAEYAGRNVKVKGVVKELNGLKTFFISEIHPVK